MFDLALGGRNLRSRGVEKLLRLADIERGGGAPIQPQTSQAQTIPGVLERLVGNGKFEIALAQIKVVRGDVADQGRHDGVPRFFGREVLRPRGFGEAANTSPDVKLPTQREAFLVIAGGEIRPFGDEGGRADRRRDESH